MGRGIRFALGLTVAATLGCTEPGVPEQPRQPPLTQAEVAQWLQSLAAARGLQLKRLVPVVLLEDDRFRAALRVHSGEVDPRERAAAEGLALTFQLLPSAPGGGRPSRIQDVLDEQVVGFYDRDADQVVLRRQGSATRKDRLTARGVIVHELEHALQAQNFEHLFDDRGLGTDGRLARSAVLEGDATLAMIAFTAASEGVPLHRAMRRVADVFGRSSVEELVRQTGESPELANAAPIARERLMFPYVAGTAFVGDLFRAGGLALVDQALRAPPTTTEHVLHPEKFVAGEAEVALAAPPVLPGFAPVVSEALGELSMRVLLEGCMPAAEARRASVGWGGDRFSVARSASGAIALSWSTAWDTVEDAAEFERALARSGPCWRPTTASPGATTGAEHVAVRRDDRVALVRGLPGAVATQLAATLLDMPATRAAARPIGPYRITRPAPLPVARRGAIDGDVWASDWLHLTARVPPGVSARVTKEIELELTRSGEPLVGNVVVSDRIASRHHDEQLLAELAQSFQEGLPHSVRGRQLVVAASGGVTLPLGPALERTWVLEGTHVFVRAHLLPVCRGMGSIVFLTAWADDYAELVLRGWLQSFRWAGPGTPPVCGLLDPKE